jgi:hypothetical protein
VQQAAWARAWAWASKHGTLDIDTQLQHYNPGAQTEAWNLKPGAHSTVPVRFLAPAELAHLAPVYTAL